MPKDAVGKNVEEELQSCMWRLLSLLRASHILTENDLPVENSLGAPDRKNLWAESRPDTLHSISRCLSDPDGKRRHQSYVNLKYLT